MLLCGSGVGVALCLAAGLQRPAPSRALNVNVGDYGSQHLQHHLPAGLDDLEIPSDFMGL
jgi:hypothetical protein